MQIKRVQGGLVEHLHVNVLGDAAPRPKDWPKDQAWEQPRPVLSSIEVATTLGEAFEVPDAVGKGLLEDGTGRFEKATAAEAKRAAKASDEVA